MLTTIFPRITIPAIIHSPDLKPVRGKHADKTDGIASNGLPDIGLPAAFSGLLVLGDEKTHGPPAGQNRSFPPAS
jgi:hypothetical protein